ncbi:hypothetical protein MPSEU_000209900 [Mayamaea pseudoterrestris]|nr:hypothetical protein MPSEU_000209900 [Mayamaea pseudoterrestris]
MTTSSSFTGGALSFKGDKKAKKKKSKSKHDHSSNFDDKLDVLPPSASGALTSSPNNEDDNLTEAERKALRRKRKREHQELEIVAKKSHRERIEEFNQALASVTEHNDIPRVSAAGNG